MAKGYYVMSATQMLRGLCELRYTLSGKIGKIEVSADFYRKLIEESTDDNRFNATCIDNTRVEDGKLTSTYKGHDIYLGDKLYVH
jgi:hypothetical protein